MQSLLGVESSLEDHTRSEALWDILSAKTNPAYLLFSLFQVTLHERKKHRRDGHRLQDTSALGTLDLLQCYYTYLQGLLPQTQRSLRDVRHLMQSRNYPVGRRRLTAWNRCVTPAAPTFHRPSTGVRRVRLNI